MSEHYSNNSFVSENGPAKSLNGGQVSTAKKLSQNDVEADDKKGKDDMSAGYTSIEDERDAEMEDEVEKQF